MKILVLIIIILIGLVIYLDLLRTGYGIQIKDLETKPSKLTQLKMLGIFDYKISVDLCNGYRSIKDYINNEGVDTSLISYIILDKIYETESIVRMEYYCYRTDSTYILYHYDIDQLLDQVLDNLRQL